MAAIDTLDDGPAVDGFAVTPSDTVDFPRSARALYVGTAGDVALVTLRGNTLTYVDVKGYIFQGCNRVMSTGTTAANIVGVY